MGGLVWCTIDATKLTTDRHEASRGLFATAELLVHTPCSRRLRRRTAVPFGMEKLEWCGYPKVKRM